MSASSHHRALTTSWDGHPIEVSEQVRLWLSPREDGSLHLRFLAPFHHDPAPAAPPGPTDRLWEHEVVEFFVAGPGDPVPYTEIEVGPHGHHLGLLLRGVRVVERSLLPLEVSVTHHEGSWEAALVVPAALLPPRPWRALLCSVHGAPEARRYLCSPALPGPKPDFHQPARWTPLDI